MSNTTQTRLRRMAAAILLVAAMAATLLPSAASATHNPNHNTPCRDAPTAEFADYERAREVHRTSIDCAVYRAITSGAGSNAAGNPVYRPRQRVTRAQMAQFVVNTLISAGHDDKLPNGSAPDEFDDTAGSFARVAINRLARANVVSGTAARAYAPDAFVTRQQMATFIVAAAELALGQGLSDDGQERFTDVAADNGHKANIEKGADAGLFQGTSTTTFAPGRVVVRDQMATFLTSLLQVIFDQSTAPQPYSAKAVVDSSTVTAGRRITGEVTGLHIQSVSVAGCGISSRTPVDRDEGAWGLQFSMRIPADTPADKCDLVFSVTFTTDRERTITLKLTVGSPATVSLASTTVQAGQALSGEITGDKLHTATATGCGWDQRGLTDRDNPTAGIQFSETVPADQPAGECDLVIRVHFTDGRADDFEITVTVTSA